MYICQANIYYTPLRAVALGLLNDGKGRQSLPFAAQYMFRG